MSEVVAFRKLNGEARKARRVAPMARMTASFERDGLGREVIAVYSANPAYGEVALGRKKKEVEAPAPKKVDLGAVMKKASQKAFRGGAAGFAAGIIQVGTFMWMRTVMNVQYAGNRVAQEEAKRAAMSPEQLAALTAKEAKKAQDWLEKLAKLPEVERKEKELAKAAADKIAAANSKLCGKSVSETIKNIYAAGASTTPSMPMFGGIKRFYAGVSLAIIQAPLSRFGDTAANTGVLALFEALNPSIPVGIQTAFASTAGACWRIAIMPVDCMKTNLQVQGSLQLTKEKIAAGGPFVLYSGAAANFAANWVGNYPWFATFNFLQSVVPQQEGKMKLVRNALIGVCASSVSDCLSNSLRVLKTTMQTGGADLSYMGAVKQIIATDGIGGLFGRGLKVRLATNIAQSMVFSVAWKAIEESLNKKAEAKAK